MDEMALRKALATLRSFKDNLPKDSTIQEKYVSLYESILDDIARETGHDLNYFHIPANELTKRVSGGEHNYDTGQWETWYTDDRQCDRDMFLIKFNGALNFIASLLDATGKRVIGFAP